LPTSDNNCIVLSSFTRRCFHADAMIFLGYFLDFSLIFLGAKRASAHAILPD
jgi:hypothetical protein